MCIAHRQRKDAERGGRKFLTPQTNTQMHTSKSQTHAHKREGHWIPRASLENWDGELKIFHGANNWYQLTEHVHTYVHVTAPRLRCFKP